MTLPVPSQRTWATSDVVTAAMMNANVRDAVNFLTGKPIAQLHQTNPQSIPNSAFTAIAFDTTDVDSYSGHSNTTNNSRYTAQVAGWYSVYGAIEWTANGTGRRITSISVNGSEIGTCRGETQASATNLVTTESESLVHLNAGDYVEIQGFQSSGAALNTAPTPVRMTVVWVHA